MRCRCGKSTGRDWCLRLECRPPGVMPTKKDRQRISAEDRVRRAALNPPRSPIYEMDLAHLIRNIRDEDSGFSIVTHDQAARLAQQLMVLCKITLREAP